MKISPRLNPLSPAACLQVEGGGLPLIIGGLALAIFISGVVHGCNESALECHPDPENDEKG